MGNFLCASCCSGAPAQLLEHTDGGEEAYHKRFLEDVVLGQGEFGVVKLVHDMQTNNNNNSNINTAMPTHQSQSQQQHQPMACKVLRKGVVFKDNVLYSPLKPEVLRGEIQMLRILRGDNYCLKLHAVYETPRCLFVVTEYCAGGEMTEYVSRQEQVFTTEDVSRIAYQLLSAVHHCRTHNVIHRDIKPENVMFADPSPGAAIRLIDFGSGTLDNSDNNDKPSADSSSNNNNNGTINNGTMLRVHSTFAGSAFYISPEMFQRSYTALTDVWSVGATLYVLVAGYPADNLQKAFNILQSGKKNRLRNLPNLPPDGVVLPESFYDLLEGCLTYRYKQRPTAETLLQHEFVTFHRRLLLEDFDGEQGDRVPELSLEQVAAAAADGGGMGGSVRQRKSGSVSLAGSVQRHNTFLGFKKFERAVTTLLAAMLSKQELVQLLDALEARCSGGGSAATNAAAAARLPQPQVPPKSMDDSTTTKDDKQKEQTLAVVKVSELKTILRDDLKNGPAYVIILVSLLSSLSLAIVNSPMVLLIRYNNNNNSFEAMTKIPNSELYDSFAYHTALLSDFARIVHAGTGGNAASLTASLRRRGGSRRGANLVFGGGQAATQQMTGSNSSQRSTSSLRSFSMKRNGSRSGRNSVHGTNVFKHMAARKKERSASIGGG